MRRYRRGGHKKGPRGESPGAVSIHRLQICRQVILTTRMPKIDDFIFLRMQIRTVGGTEAAKVFTKAFGAEIVGKALEFRAVRHR